MLAHAEALLAHAAAIETDLVALTRGDVGRLRLAGFYTAWSTFLPAAVAEFTRAHPRVDLELEQLDPPAALRQLGAGELDLAVIYRFEPTDPVNRWAYGAIYGSSTERTRALPGWLTHYNYVRRHGSLSHKPPGTRLRELTNPPGNYS